MSSAQTERSDSGLPNQSAEESRYGGWNYSREMMRGEAPLEPERAAKLMDWK
jgi:hypothetical protein